jgi:hypothetical protein
VVHEAIGIFQATDDAMNHLMKGGLAQQITSEQLPGLHLTAFQELDELSPGEWGGFPYLDQETKPRRFAVRSGPGQNQEFLVWLERLD